MSDGIYILVGENKTGPFTHELFTEYRDAGRFPPETLCWKEGWSEWKPIAEVDDDEELEESGGDVQLLMQGDGYRLTSEKLFLGNEVFPLGIVKNAKVVVELAYRMPAYTQVTISAVVLIVAVSLLVTPDLFTPDSIFFKGLVGLAAVSGLFLLRGAIVAFRPDATFVNLRLASGDERILRIKGREARDLVSLVNELAPQAALKAFQKQEQHFYPQ